MCRNSLLVVPKLEAAAAAEGSASPLTRPPAVSLGSALEVGEGDGAIEGHLDAPAYPPVPRGVRAAAKVTPGVGVKMEVTP